MNSRSNQLLAGIVVLLLGLFVLFQRHVQIDIGPIMLIICGCAFVVSYKTKHKSWSLILGGFMIYIGVSNLLKVYFLGFNIVSILGAMFFIVPGVIFLTLFFERGRSGALFPASFMIWFGVFIIVSGISFIRINGFSLLLAFSGLAFYTIALLGKKKWAFSVGTALVILSIIFMGLFGKLIASIIGLSQLFAVALILLSLVMIIRALIKRKE